MTIKEAILKSLGEIGGLTNYNDVTNHINYRKSFKSDFKYTKALPEQEGFQLCWVISFV